MTTGEDTLEKVWRPWYEPSSEQPQSQCDRWIWVDMCIANEVAMMSMETNAGLTFMDIAPMLKINELEDICLGH
jgi:hypothetical protein